MCYEWGFKYFKFIFFIYMFEIMKSNIYTINIDE